MIESTRLCPCCLQTLRLSNDWSGPCYRCDSCGWGTHDESKSNAADAVNPLDLPRYIRAEREDRPPQRAAGE